MKRDDKIKLSLKAHHILMTANQGPGYSTEVASKAAYESIMAMPSDCREKFLQRIVDGDKDMIELYRWPLNPSDELKALLAR